MQDNEDARRSDQTAMDVIERVLSAISESKDSLDRLLVIAQHENGKELELYSNARSEAELCGMLHMAVHAVQITTVEDEE